MPRTGITFIEHSDAENFLSYEELYNVALAALKGLQERGMSPGHELVLQIEDNRTFIIIFWACILGGIIPVPLSAGQQDEHRKKVFNVWQQLHHPYLVIDTSHPAKLAAFASGTGAEDIYAVMERRMLTADALLKTNGAGSCYAAKADDIAFIQFSSGSTGKPKGVMLTHRNLLCNMQAISNAAAYTTVDSTLSWMPLTHDMGLIGFHLNPLFSGMQQYLMPVNLFIRRPALWIEKASRHNVTILCSPNFGYEYFLRHFKESNPGWDLSAVRLIYNGAEPVSEKLCRRFSTQLSSFGLRRRAMCPVYGLAEASLAVSISGMEDEVQWLELDRDHLNAGDKILPGNGNTATFVNVGRPVDQCSIRIVDNEGIAIEEGIVGHIQIRGENVTAGYYNNPDETQQVITTDGWLKTGDLGVMHAGALYVTGRYKDLVFVNGKNYYSHDLEQAALEIPGIELNKIVITGCFNGVTQREQALAFVFHRGDQQSFIPVAAALKAVMNRRFELELDKIIPVKDIPRTTSGKLRRFRLVELYNMGAFTEVIHEVPREQDIPENVFVTEQEKRLLEIWKEVTGISLNVEQDIFEAGANSLKVAEVSMKVLKEFEVEIPLDVFYTSRTIRVLAQEISGMVRQVYEPLPISPQQSYYPASVLQKRLYYHWEVNRMAITYNIPEAFRITGALDVSRLEACIRTLISRHDMLRSSFHLQDGEPVFMVQEQVEFTLNAEPCTTATPGEQLQHMVQPFDLSAAPLFRIRLLTLGSHEHILFADFHHIIADGISVYNFISGLLALYKGDKMAPLSLQYKDYVSWEQQNLRSAALEEQERYWLEHLQGELPVLDLPLDFLRPQLFTGQGEKLAFSLSPLAIEKIRHFAVQNNCTPHTVLLTTYNLLLSIYTGQEDIITGIPVAGRRHADLADMQGMFVNNLAIRSTIAEDASFRQLLQATAESMLAAMKNQDYPFDHLVRKLKIKRDISRNPLFDSMFVYQNMGLPVYEGSELTCSRYFFNPGFSRFDVSIEIFDDGHTMQCYLEYAVKLFSRETANRLAKHFEYLLNTVLEHPDEKHLALPPMPGNHACKNICIDPAQTIHQLFEEQAIRTPANIAIEQDDIFITYQQLNERANALAERLKQQGLTAGSIAAIILPRSPELIISILAILKAGGAYLPIDTELPPERMALLIAESKCGWVLVNDSTSTLLPATPQEATLLNLQHNAWPAKLQVTGDHMTGPADMAYIIYTSGTTGIPKGVVIEHRSLVNYITWACKQYIRGEVCSFPLFTSISFDLTVTSIFAPLITGNRMIIYSEDESGILINKVVADNRCHIIKLTPSHLKVLKELEFPAVDEISIRRFIVGGEAFPTHLAAAIHEKFDHVEIYNEYGPTEGTVGCMIYQFDPSSDQPEVPIGIPIDNTRIYLLDKGLRPVPPGVKGEIFISGTGVARGYWRNEMLTERQFLPDPFMAGQRMYKTGDLARSLPGGDITYIGRTDKQVKINGYRIEIAEIEHWLSGYENITAAIVTMKQLPDGQKCLYAYYSSGTGAAIEETACRNYLAARLPYYMIPAQFIRIDLIPLTRNGKVDFAALPDIQVDRTSAEDSLDTGSLAASLIKIWEDVLGESQVRVTDNFFELGGDSVKAVQISSRMRDKGFFLHARDILIYQTIKQLSLRVTAAQEDNHYEQGIITGERALLPVESWFFTHDLATPGFYNQSLLLNLHRKTDLPLLEAAWQMIIEHHDGLRINYNPVNSTIFYNSDHLKEQFSVSVHRADTDEALKQVCKELRAGFDLSASLLLKVALVKNDAAEKLFITAHHLVIDGISWRILLEDFYTIYTALEKGNKPELRKKTATAADYRNLLIAHSTSWHSRSVAAYWNKIAHMPTALHTDMEATDWRAENLRRINGLLNKEDTRWLLRQAGHYGESGMPACLNTALALALKKWTGGHEWIIEQELHGRDLEGIDLSLTVGWFTNIHPAKITLEEGSIEEQVKAVQEQLRNIPQKGISYGVSRYMQDRFYPMQQRTACRLNYLGQFDQEMDNELFSFCYNETGDDTASENNITAMLDVNVLVINKELQLRLDYNTKAYKASTMQEIMDTMLECLATIIEYAKDKQQAYRIEGFNAVDLNDEELNELFC